MKNIIIFTLEGCSICKSLKDQLISKNIKFTEKCCESFPKDCDKIEQLTKCEYYPMVQIQDFDNSTILCLADNINDLKDNSELNKKYRVIYNHSINSILDYIKNKA